MPTPRKTTRGEAKQKFGIALGKRIKEARTTAKMSQEELAHKAGLYRTYVGHVETGTYSPSVYVVARLAAAMEVDLGDLLRDLK